MKTTYNSYKNNLTLFIFCYRNNLYISTYIMISICAISCKLVVYPNSTIYRQFFFFFCNLYLKSKLNLNIYVLGLNLRRINFIKIRNIRTCLAYFYFFLNLISFYLFFPLLCCVVCIACWLKFVCLFICLISGFGYWVLWTCLR